MCSPILVIESFRSWAEASTKSYGGDIATVFPLAEDVDFLTGDALRKEAVRVAVATLRLQVESPLTVG